MDRAAARLDPYVTTPNSNRMRRAGACSRRFLICGETKASPYDATIILNRTRRGGCPHPPVQTRTISREGTETLPYDVDVGGIGYVGDGVLDVPSKSVHGGSNVSLRLGPLAVLTVHRTVIHCRSCRFATLKGKAFGRSGRPPLQ